MTYSTQLKAKHRLQVLHGWSGEDLICNHNDDGEITNDHLCLPQNYNKFDLPYPNKVNPIDIGIDITDVLRINDKVGGC